MGSNINWRKNHPQRFRELCSKANKTWRHKIKNELYKLLGNKCANPYNLNHGDFENDPRFLQVDHVHNRGAEDRREIKKHRANYYNYVLKQVKAGSKEYQLLCANCNWLKEIKRKEEIEIERNKKKNV